MTEICDKKLCCGCMACKDVCPKAAISQKSDCGFAYPDIDEDKCIDCGRCRRVCPVTKNHDIRCETAYAVINNDDAIRMSSSSGGAFAALAQTVCEKGGVVFGAAFDEALVVRHIAADNCDEIRRLMGSKYVQSSTDGVYARIRNALEDGKTVLFSGTPCQCVAVKSVFGDAEKLFLVDFICHGVPSPDVWKKYLNEVCPDGADDVSFRDKSRGWEDFSIRINSGGVNLCQSHVVDPYYRVFFSNTALRESCYECSWKGSQRASDLTVADFWGIDRVFPQMNDNRGVSAVLVNSEKGRLLLEESSEKLTVVSCDKEAVLKGNGMYYSSVKRPGTREEFFQKLSVRDVDGICRDLGLYPTKSSLAKLRTRSMIKKLYRIIKRLSVRH